MCLICTELSKGLITTKDARRNAREMADSLTTQHALELMQKIENQEAEEAQPEPWHPHTGYPWDGS